MPIPSKSDLLQSAVARTPDSELVDMMLNTMPDWAVNRWSNDELARTIRSSFAAATPSLEAVNAARSRLLARDPDKEKQMAEITFQIDPERVKFNCTPDEMAEVHRAKNAAELPAALRDFVCHEAINQVSIAMDRLIKRDISPNGKCITIRRGARGGLFASVPVPDIGGGHRPVVETTASRLPPEPPVVEVRVPPSEDELNARLQDAVSKVEDFTSSLSPTSNGPFVAKTILRILKGEIAPC
nr:hypothetical protein [uncultured Cohaesibacter sp.]